MVEELHTSDGEIHPPYRLYGRNGGTALRPSILASYYSARLVKELTYMPRFDSSKFVLRWGGISIAEVRLFAVRLVAIRFFPPCEFHRPIYLLSV